MAQHRRDSLPSLQIKNNLPISIRTAEKRDEGAVKSLMAGLFPNSRVQRKDGDFVLLAETEGTIAGFCHFRMRRKTAYIYGLGVLSDFRNRGLGGMLLSEALGMIDNSGMQTVLLKVRALNPASNLYVKFGFFERQSGETLLLVRKRSS